MTDVQLPASGDTQRAEVSTPGADDFPVSTEGLMLELIGRASELLEAQNRLHRLLSANRALVSELSLPTLLSRITEVARDLVGCQYAGLGVLGADGLVEQFFHDGTGEGMVAAIGQIPQGLGLLGSVIDAQRPTRLNGLGDVDGTGGVSDAPPPLESFLGVPILARNGVFGNLYLINRLGGDFTTDDEELISSLAATAGIAIDNARLYEEQRQQQLWLRASAEVNLVLLSPAGNPNPLQLIVEVIMRLADADVVSLVVPGGQPGVLEVAVATGDGEDELKGLRYRAENSLGALAMEAGHGVLLSSIDEQERYTADLTKGKSVGAAMAVPLSGAAGPQGAVVVGRREGRRSFDDADLAMAEAFASKAAIAIELVEARIDHQRVAVLEDRNRIARDLHDHVIQRLFAAGLTIQSLASDSRDHALGRRLNAVIEEIDGAIRQIRTSIFQLRGDDKLDLGLRSAVLDVLQQLTPVLAFQPSVRFVGPADNLIDEKVIADVEAVIRESVTNAARHAAATAVSVLITVDGQTLSIDVLDNGSGFVHQGPRSGLDNLLRRAENLGGILTVGTRESGGTHLHWAVPVSP